MKRSLLECFNEVDENTKHVVPDGPHQRVMSDLTKKLCSLLDETIAANATEVPTVNLPSVIRALYGVLSSAIVCADPRELATLVKDWDLGKKLVGELITVEAAKAVLGELKKVEASL